MTHFVIGAVYVAGLLAAFLLGVYTGAEQERQRANKEGDGTS